MTDSDAPDALVVTVSTRASAGVYADRSGPIIVESMMLVTRWGITDRIRPRRRSKRA